MLDFTKLWNKIYLFGPNPVVLSRSDQIFFWLAAGFVVVGMAAKIVEWYLENGRPKKILLNRLFHLFFTSGLLLLIWYGARLQLIPWISAHFTALLVLAIFLVWLGFITRYYLRDYRDLEQRWKDEQIKNKYLSRS